MPAKTISIPCLSLNHKFHHIGYATASVVREREFFENLGYIQEGREFTDPAQGIYGCFLQGPGPRLELLENLAGRETLTPWLDAGTKMYHIAYEVNDIEAAGVWAGSQRGKMVVAPLPAIAFQGRRVSFFAFPRGPLIEFIEL